MGLLAELIAETDDGSIATSATPATHIRARGQGVATVASVATPAHALDTTAMRERLLHFAEREAIDIELVHALPESELAATIEQIAACDSDVQANVLRGYLRGLRDVDLRRRGKVPADETAAALCRHCGPVWVAPEVANAAPNVNGWAVMLGCPWCHVRKDGALAIARPPVTCNTCLHYMPDTVNPAAGAGTCVAERNPQRPWPNAVQSCKFWKPKEEQRDGSE